MKYQYSTIGVLLYNIRYSDTQVNIEGKLDYFNAIALLQNITANT